jgi:hypothetical protein
MASKGGIGFSIDPLSLLLAKQRVDPAQNIFRLSSLPAQRASMNAAAARLSSGNSRKIQRTLPVSM